MQDEYLVSDTSGQEKSFNPGVLINDIAVCFGHSNEKASQAYWLAQTVEDSLLANKRLVVSTKEIALLAHQILLTFDTLAGDQYAARHQRALK